MLIADWITLAGVAGIMMFLWNLNRDMHRDMTAIRERLAKLEGSVSTLKTFLSDHRPPYAKP